MYSETSVVNASERFGGKTRCKVSSSVRRLGLTGLEVRKEIAFAINPDIRFPLLFKKRVHRYLWRSVVIRSPRIGSDRILQQRH